MGNDFRSDNDSNKSQVFSSVDLFQNDSNVASYPDLIKRRRSLHDFQTQNFCHKRKTNFDKSRLEKNPIEFSARNTLLDAKNDGSYLSNNDANPKFINSLCFNNSYQPTFNHGMFAFCCFITILLIDLCKFNVVAIIF